MYEVVFENDPQAFLDKYGDWLKEKYVEHSLILGLCNGGVDGRYKGVKGVAVLEEDKPVLLAVKTDPAISLVLSEGDDKAVVPLVKALKEAEFSIPGLTGPIKIVEEFADRWLEAKEEKFKKYKGLLIYALKEVVPPIDVLGEFKIATEDDIDLMSEWYIAFTKEVLAEHEHATEVAAAERISSNIANKTLGLWVVEGVPVSCASFHLTERVARVGGVYTPSSHRGKGYASSVVAGLSQHALDQGVGLCCLYTDAGNPTSNSIYKKIGYKLVTDSVYYLPEEKVGEL